jgi:TP901 family phage tail tape measure protein
MDSLDLGDALDGLKEIGAGVLSKIPGEAKVAAAAIAGITIALKECAEEGVSQFTRGMETLSGALSGIVGIARDVGQEIRDAFENITGMQMDFSSLIEIPIEFESMMAEVGAIAGVTGDAFEELEDKARELGATTRYSATEVAEAMKYMGMAGWDNKEIMAGLESVLNLATVANMDLGQASDFVTDGLTALGMEAKDAAYMVDILAAASTSSNTTVAQMQRAFTNCAPVAGTLGINIKDLSMALGLMADKGVKGAKAGTALKNLMANLSAPTEKQLAYIKKFNLEGAQQAIVNGNLIDGIKQMKAALKGLSPQQQNAIITTIAGKEALSGISALLNTTEGDLAELEDALNSCDGAAQEMADNFDNTLKGALKGLASAMQETILQVFDKTEKSIKDFTKQLTEFFHILNGFSDFGGLKGLEGAFAFLENASQGWGKAIADGLEKAIGAIDNFLNSDVFDNLLQVGTNIINGIADGIKRAADNGSLDSAISTAIRKIATWFSENLDTIVDVGKEVIDAISKGISENSDEIGEAIKAVMEMQTTIDKAIAKEKWKLIG